MLPIKLLFIPVSSPKGSGEYVRSLSIAQEVQSLYPDAQLHFILSEQTDYAKNCPFPVTLCPTSPTFHNNIVKQCIDTFKPDIVLFDAAGRSSQLRYCKEKKAQTIFICPRVKKIAKSLKLRRLLYTDQIWISQPTITTPALNWWQKTKIKLLNKTAPIIIGPIFSRPNPQTSHYLQKKYELQPAKYIVVNAGGGGYLHNNIPVGTIFLKAAELLASLTSHKVVLVHGINAACAVEKSRRIIEIDQLPPNEFNSLLHGASAALLAGGSVVLQALSYKKRIVSAPITDEQKKRISLFKSKNLLMESILDENVMANKMLDLINSEHRLTGMQIENGLDKATIELQKLIEQTNKT